MIIVFEQGWLWLALLIAVLLAIAVLLFLLRRRQVYCRRSPFLSPAERVFYDVLAEAVEESGFLVLIKVRLADLIMPVADLDNSKRMSAFNRIKSKHVDFVLCDPDSMEPVLIIELDDRSHDREDRQERDRFVDQAFADAGMPILHVPVQRKYDAEALLEDIMVATENAEPAGREIAG